MSAQDANRERYTRAAEIFNTAIDLAEDERAALLASIAGDAELRALVDSMLEADRAAGPEAANPLVAADRLIAGFVLDDSSEKDEGPTPRIDLVPDAVGGYRILEPIGSGGMGVVYLAEQETPRRKVALKIVRPEISTSDLVHRFRLEGEALGRLAHDGIAQIHEAGRAPMVIEGQTVATVEFIAMEYVAGVPLDQWRAWSSPDLATQVELVARVAEAIHAAHESGIVHRDLKPQNILVRADGTPKVIDFGVARLTAFETLAMQTAAGAIVGTLSYMSPEQVDGGLDEIDGRSDVYSLGVVLYQLLAGRLPYDVGEKSIAEAARVIRESDPIRPSAIDLRLSGDLENIIHKTLEKERERRYTSASELARDLRRHLADEPVSARPPSRIYVMRKFARRHRAAVLGGTTAALALMAGAILALLFAIEASEQADVAENRRQVAADAAYLASLRAAALALEKEDFTALEEALASAPEERRGWEWRYLRGRLGRSRTYFANHSTAAFDGDGRLRIATTRGGRRLVWTPALSRTVELQHPALPADDLLPDHFRFSSDARRVFARIGDHLVTWDADDGRLISDLTPPRGGPTYFALLARGRWVALHYDEVTRIIDVETGERLHEIEIDGARNSASSIDGRWAYVCGSSLTVASLAGPRSIRQVPLRHWVTQIAVSPDDGQVAMTMLQDRSILLHDTRSDRVRMLRASEPYPSGQVTHALAFLDDDTLIRNDIDDSLEFIDMGGATRFRLPTPLRQISGVAVSPDRSLIAAYGTGGCYVVDLEARARPQVLEGNQGGIYAVAVSGDNTLVATGGWDHHINVRSTVDKHLLARIPTGTTWHGMWERTAVQYLSFDDATNLNAWAYGHRRFALLSGERVDGDGRDDEAWVTHTSRILDARIACYNDGVATVSSADGRVRTEVEGSEVPRVVLVEEDRGRRRVLPARVTAVALSPDGKRVAIGSVNGLELLDRESLEPAAHQGRRLEFMALEYTADGSRIVSGTRDGVIRIWDATTLDLIARLPGHTDYVYSLRFSPDGTRLFSAGGDGTVRVWDTAAPEVRREEVVALRSARTRMAPLVERALASGRAPATILADFADAEAIDRVAVRDLLIEAAAP